MSTIDSIVSQEVAAAALKKDVEMLDGPISGGQGGAIEGTLTIMVGGKEEVFKQCQDIFAAYGILLAIVEREKSGRHQRVETSLLEGLVAVLGFQAALDVTHARELSRVKSGLLAESPAQDFARWALGQGL